MPGRVVDALASEKQLAKELDSQRRQAEEWHGRARRALEAGNEALAREALLRRRSTTASSPTWKPRGNRPAAPGTDLKPSWALEAKLEEARLKKGGLVARRGGPPARADGSGQRPVSDRP